MLRENIYGKEYRDGFYQGYTAALFAVQGGHWSSRMDRIELFKDTKLFDWRFRNRRTNIPPPYFREEFTR